MLRVSSKLVSNSQIGIDTIYTLSRAAQSLWPIRCWDLCTIWIANTGNSHMTVYAESIPCKAINACCALSLLVFFECVGRRGGGTVYRETRSFSERYNVTGQDIAYSEKCPLLIGTATTIARYCARSALMEWSYIRGFWKKLTYTDRPDCIIVFEQQKRGSWYKDLEQGPAGESTSRRKYLVSIDDQFWW